MNKEFLYKEDTYEVIGACMEVHKDLGKGFSEIVYSDALEIELSSRKILYDREVSFHIYYKDVKLPHNYYADFVIKDKIILELKTVERLTNSHIKQTLNYLAASNLKVGLLINFGQDSLEYKRIAL